MTDPTDPTDPPETTDPPPATGPAEARLREALAALGVADDELARAEAEGSLALLAIERTALGQDLRYTTEEAAARSGLDPERIEQTWRSLGFPAPQPGDVVFSEVDVANFRAVADLLSGGAVRPELALQMTRVIGSSMARVAEAMIDAVTARTEPGESAVAQVPDPEVGVEAGTFLSAFPDVLAQVWRRHLQEAARRRYLRGGDEDTGLVVGFADLVGFTALAQQVSEEELAEVVDAFERLAYDVVVSGGGRVVKMIGDEVMFVADDAPAAARVALDLADASRDAAGLSDVRVGLAMGPVLEREGDAYGPTVNRASRITSIAYPGTVIVSPEVRDALAGDGAFAFRAMRPRTLKHMGRLNLAVLRRAEDPQGTIREVIDDRRRQMRAVVRQRLPARLLDPRGEEIDAD